MDRLKKNPYFIRMQDAVRTGTAAAREAVDPPALPAPSQAAPPRADDLGRLNLQNASLGNQDGDCLCVGVLDFTKAGMFSNLREVFEAGKMLGEVKLQTPVNTRVEVPMLPVNIVQVRDDGLEQFSEAASNPTLWFRRPFALLLLVSTSSTDEYRNEVRGRITALLQKAAALPPGVTVECCLVYVRPPDCPVHDTHCRAVFGKLRDDFSSGKQKDRVARLDGRHKQPVFTAKDTQGWDDVGVILRECISAAFAARVKSFATQLQTLQSAVLGSVSHFVHFFLVKDALAVMLERAQLLDEANKELIELDFYYEDHLRNNPELHVASVEPERDIARAVSAVEQSELQFCVLPDGRINSFVMRHYLFGNQLRMATKLAVANYNHVTVCAERAIRYLHEMSLMLIDLRRRDSIPALFPQLWMANACFCISRSLWLAKNVAVEPEAPPPRPTDAPREPLRTPADPRKPPTPRTPVTPALPERPGAVAVLDWGVHVPLERLIDDIRQATAPPAGGGGGGADAPQPGSVRWDRLYQCLAQLHCVACAELMDVAALTNLRSVLHPYPDSLDLMRGCNITPTNTRIDRKQNAALSGDSAGEPQTPPPPPRAPICVSTAMLFDKAVNKIRGGEPSLSAEHLHLGSPPPPPPWLAKSPWSRTLVSGSALEELLQALTCSAAWCFLKGRRPRQCLLLALNAVCYMMRAGHLESASAILWEAAAVVVQQGWHAIAIPVLDKLLACAAVLRSPAAATAASLLLKTDPSAIRRVFPPPDHDAQHLFDVALHVLRHLSQPDDINLSFNVYVDLERSQASAFFGEEVDGDAVLRPPAGWPCNDSREKETCAQLSGPADTCSVTLCVVSELPVPLEVKGLVLHLANLVFRPSLEPKSPDTLEAFSAEDSPFKREDLEAESVSGFEVTTLEDRSPTALPPPRPRHRRGMSNASGSSFSSFAQRNMDEASQLFLRNSSSYSLLPQAEHPGHGPPSTPPAPPAANTAASSPTSARSAASATPLSDWCIAYFLPCPAVDAKAAVTLRPGDNTLTFKACPVLQGIYVMENAEAVTGFTTGPVEHAVYFGALASSKPYAGPAASSTVGAVLKVSPQKQHLDLHAVLGHGGVLLEAHHQWLGIRMLGLRGSISGMTVRVSVRGDDGSVPLLFASVAAAGAAPGEKRRPAVLWQVLDNDAVEGSCATLDMHDGEVMVPGSLPAGSSGILWLPISAAQHSRQPETVDVCSAHLFSLPDVLQLQNSARPTHSAGSLELALTYRQGCHRCKHVRVPLTCKEPFTFAITAVPLPDGLLAIQLTHVSHLEYPVTVTAYHLDLQAGLKHTDTALPKPALPICLPAKGTCTSMFVVRHTPAGGPAAAAPAACRLRAKYKVTRETISSMPFAAAGSAGGGGALGGFRCTLPASACALTLRSAVHSSGSDRDRGAGGGDGEHASVCSFEHIFFLEVSSLTMTPSGAAAPSYGIAAAEHYQDSIPVITYMGPSEAALGKVTTLWWHVQMQASSFALAEDGSTVSTEGQRPSDGSDDDAEIAYELLMPGHGWERASKPKGRLPLPRAAGSFATIQVDIVPTSAGSLPTPTLRIFPPSLPPIMGGRSQVLVA